MGKRIENQVLRMSLKHIKIILKPILPIQWKCYNFLMINFGSVNCDEIIIEDYHVNEVEQL